MRCHYVSSVGALLLVTGCSNVGPIAQSESDTTLTDRTEEEPPTTEAPVEETHPAPAVTVTLESGQIVEFYDYPDGVLIMERGKATPSTRPVLPQLAPLDDLVDIWSTLRPDLPVPSRLLELQDKVATTDRPARRTAHEAQSRPAGPTSGGERGIMPANACMNICCDGNWLQNNLCAPGNTQGNYSWYFLDYGSSYANTPQTYYVWGAACAGRGISSFSVTTGTGSGGTWSVEPGYYTWYQWKAGCYFLNCPARTWINTSVNSPSSQHLHSYCGVFDN
jgi:hypothetical protein